MDDLQKIAKKRRNKFAKALETMTAKDVSSWLNECPKGTIVRCVRVTTPSGETIELVSPRVRLP